jgi:hypothetical protein
MASFHVVEMIENCLVTMFGFLHGSIHMSEVVTCDDNKLEMKFIKLRF